MGVLITAYLEFHKYMFMCYKLWTCLNALCHTCERGDNGREREGGREGGRVKERDREREREGGREGGRERYFILISIIYCCMKVLHIVSNLPFRKTVRLSHARMILCINEKGNNNNNNNTQYAAVAHVPSITHNLYELPHQIYMYIIYIVI